MAPFNKEANQSNQTLSKSWSEAVTCIQKCLALDPISYHPQDVCRILHSWLKKLLSHEVVSKTPTYMLLLIELEQYTFKERKEKRKY